MKKILYYCPTFYPENSGYANAFIGLLNSVKENFKIEVITAKELGSEKEIEIKNVKINRFKNRFDFNQQVKSFYVQFKMALFVNKNYANYDKIFIETFEDVYFLTLLSKKACKKAIVRVHSTAETEYNFYFKKIFYRISKFLINNSIKKKIFNIASTNNYHVQFVKEIYYKKNLFEISKRNFFVIPNCLESNDDFYMKDFNKKKLFVTLGRLDFDGAMQKGQGDLLNAIIPLKRDFISTNSKLIIIGNGSYFNLIQKILNENELSFVQLIERLNHEETLTVLKSADFSILPARFEGLSMFALESIGCSNAVIFSETGGLIDLYNNNGFLFPPQNIGELSNSIKKAIYLGADELEKMKRNSHSHFQNNFSPKIVASSFEKAINNINILS